MCVIIIKEKKNKMVTREILRASSIINPHGLGVTWLDTYETEFFDSDEWDVLDVRRPYIAHFRYATIGKVCMENCHPFAINEDELLFQNGSVHNLGYGDITDAEHMADILSETSKDNWASILEMSDCRWVTINTKEKTFEVYNKKDWITKNTIMYSKANVLECKFIAVYGTLKLNGSNYFHYLSRKEFLSGGETKNKYRMINEGLPYVSSKKNVGGHNIDVDVFLVDKFSLAKIDRLESHPNWYCRKEAKIILDGGADSLMAWVYFNDTVDYAGKEFIKSYDGSFRKHSSSSNFKSVNKIDNGFPTVDKSDWGSWDRKYDDVWSRYMDDEEDEELSGGTQLKLIQGCGSEDGCKTSGFDKNAVMTCNQCNQKVYPDEFEEMYYCFGCEDYKDIEDLYTIDGSWVSDSDVITREEVEAVRAIDSGLVH